MRDRYLYIYIEIEREIDREYLQSVTKVAINTQIIIISWIIYTFCCKVLLVRGLFLFLRDLEWFRFSCLQENCRLVRKIGLVINYIFTGQRMRGDLHTIHTYTRVLGVARIYFFNF